MRLTKIWAAGLAIGWASACAPKGMAEGGDASAEDTSADGSTSTGGGSHGEGTTASESSGVTSGPDPTTGMTGTTGMIGECKPGDTKPGPFDCGEDCVCSDQGMWQCPAVFGCDTSEPPPQTTTTESTSGESSGGDTEGTTGGVVIDLPACEELAPSDPFMLDKAAILGDVLNVSVSFGGGCEKHDFVLCQMGFKDDVLLVGIDHDAHGDMCDAFINESRDLDLTPLQVLPSPVKLALADWPNVLEYVF